MKTNLRNRVVAAAFAAAALTATSSLLVPAHAALTGDTTTTFSLVGGELAITAPASKALGSGTTGANTVSAQLGAVSVADTRGVLLGAWTTSVSSTDFSNTTTGGGTANETILKASADYWSGAATATTGTGAFLPGQALVAAKQTLASSRTAFSASVLVGNNTASFNPTVVINVPSAAVAGDYTGTITHSIA